MKEQKYIITFAGPVGSSKTSISNYLSTRLNLPVFNNDAIRTEVLEDLGELDDNEFNERRLQRLEHTLKQGNSLIIDASVDRHWSEYRDRVGKISYKVFIISLDFSKDFLEKLYRLKGYTESLKNLTELLNDHKKFLVDYPQDVSVSISDKDFLNRLEISFTAVKEWLDLRGEKVFIKN